MPAELKAIYQQLDVMIYSTGIMVAFAVILGFAVIYSALFISFEKRKRELSLQRLMDFRDNEVSSLLLKENFLQSVLGIAIDLPFGYLIAVGYATTLKTDLFTFPIVIYSVTYFLSVLGSISFITLAYLLVHHKIKKFELIESLKSKD